MNLGPGGSGGRLGASVPSWELWGRYLTTADPGLCRRADPRTVVLLRSWRTVHQCNQPRVELKRCRSGDHPTPGPGRMPRIEQQVMLPGSDGARNLQRGALRFVEPSIPDGLRRREQIVAIPPLRKGQNCFDLRVRHVDLVDEVGCQTVETLVVHQSFQRRKGTTFGCIIQIPGTSMPPTVGPIPALSRKSVFRRRAKLLQRNPEHSHIGTPCIMASARFSTLAAPTSVASISSGDFIPRLRSGALSHFATASLVVNTWRARR